MTHTKHLIASAFLTLLMAAPAMAQGGPPPGADRLHNMLRLRPDQEQAWRTFQQANAGDPQEEQRRQAAFERMENMRAPQRMDFSLQMMRTDLADMERRSQALKAFYGALSPDQQQIFDRETLRAPDEQR